MWPQNPNESRRMLPVPSLEKFFLAQSRQDVSETNWESPPDHQWFEGVLGLLYLYFELNSSTLLDLFLLVEFVGHGSRCFLNFVDRKSTWISDVSKYPIRMDRLAQLGLKTAQAKKAKQGEQTNPRNSESV